MVIPSIDSSVFFVLVGLLAGVLVMLVSCILLTFLSGVISRRTHTQVVTHYPGVEVQETKEDEEPGKDVIPTLASVGRGEAPKSVRKVKPRRLQRPAVAVPPQKVEPAKAEVEAAAATATEEVISEPSAATVSARSQLPHYQYTVSGQTEPFDTLLEALSAFPEEVAKYKNRRPSWNALPEYVRKNMTRTFLKGAGRGR